MQNIKFCCGFFQTAFRFIDKRQYSGRSGGKCTNTYMGPLNIESQGGGGPRPIIYFTAVTHFLYTFVIILYKSHNLCLALKLSDKNPPCLMYDPSTRIK